MVRRLKESAARAQRRKPPKAAVLSTKPDGKSDESSPQDGGVIGNDNHLNIQTPKWMVPLLRRSRYKAAYGGRGSGKSHGFAALMIGSHIADPNRSSVCVREVQKSLNQSVKRLLEQKIRQLEVGDYFDIRAHEIRSRKGHGVIIFQGMADHTAESIKSLEGYDCAWVEEAQSISQRSLDLLRPTIRKPGSELWFTWNPKFKTDPIDAFLRAEDPPPNSIVVEVNYDKNPWFSKSTMVAEMEYDQRTNRDKYDHVWGGKYLQYSEARVFKRWHVEDFEAPKDAILRFGCDWGFHPDPLTLVRIYIMGRRLYIEYEAWALGCEIEDTPSLFLTIPESEKWQIVAGADRPERIRSMQRSGFKVIPAVRGPNSVQEGIEWLENYEIIVHSRCTHAISELELFSRKVDPLTNEVLPILETTHNHIIEAIRYACEAVRRTAQGKGNPRAGFHNVVPLQIRQKWGGMNG